MTWDLRHGSCLSPLDGISTLEAGAVDVVITDPPYLARTIRGAATTPTARNRSGGARTELAAIGGLSPDEIDFLGAEFLRVARRWILIFSCAEGADLWRAALGEHYVRTGAWIYDRPQPQISGDRPANGLELVILGHAPRARGAGRMRWNGGGRAAIWRAGQEHGAARPDHPCPKPFSLMRELVRDFSEAGETICDPFAGSGTTLAAARYLGRRGLGWEVSRRFHALASRRIAATHEQLEIGA